MAQARHPQTTHGNSVSGRQVLTLACRVLLSWYSVGKSVLWCIEDDIEKRGDWFDCKGQSKQYKSFSYRVKSNFGLKIMDDNLF